MQGYHTPLRTTFRLLVPVLVAATCLLGQEVPYTLKVDVPLVSVDVTVTDASGSPVTDLTVEDFKVFENGVEQEIRYFSPTSAAYNILLLFDSSGSTQHKWQFMQRAVAGFIANLRPQDRIQIDSFDSELVTLTRWSDDRRKSIDALSELIRPLGMGSTDFYRALDMVDRREFKGVTGRRLIVVLTDGRDTSTYKDIIARNRLADSAQDKTFQRTLKTVREQRIPVHFIALNTDKNLEPNTTGADEYRNLQRIYPRSDLPQQYLKEVRSRMEQLAEESGGRILFPTQFEDIVPLYEKISRELGTAYSISYTSGDSRTDGSLRRIEVRTADGNLRVTQSRTSYFAR